MKTVQRLTDLAQFGIGYLTGEACAYSLRALFDVSARGRELVLAYLGLPNETRLESPYNSRVDGEEAVGSIMLSGSQLTELAVFCMLRGGALMVIVDDDNGVVTGVEKANDDEIRGVVYAAAEAGKRVRVVNQPTGNRVHDRNVHEMTGRDR